MTKKRALLLVLTIVCSSVTNAQGKITVLSEDLLNVFSGSKIQLFSEVSYNSIPEVSLNEYQSVQKRSKKMQNPKIALGVGISGGGSRAQFFSTGVLLGLEEIKDSKSQRNFLTEIDYYSTVSGGCFSAGYYLTILKNKLLKDQQSFNDFYFSKADAYKAEVNKTANMYSLLYNNRNERGDKVSMSQQLDFEVLQYDSSNAQNPDKFDTQMQLSDFFVSKESHDNPQLPMFVANGTDFNNGERFPFMPHVIRALEINSSLAPNLAEIPLNENQFSDGYNFPLTYAITASSAFPGVLPKIKFGIKNKEEILCLVDGGASDNTGYETLIELLNADTSVANNNKKALFIDCFGEGKKSPFISNEKIKLVTLLETASLYTVLTKYMTFEKDLQNVMERCKIPTMNYVVIGFETLRDHLSGMQKDQAYRDLVTKLKNTADTESNWIKLYTHFKNELIDTYGKDSFKKDKNGNIDLASLASSNFENFTAKEVLILYEYSSQIETKLKITPDEKEMLILSGRFTAFLKTKELQQLLVENK